MTNQEQYEMLWDAHEKQQKYRWHDLRKNPNDLPEHFKDVICCLQRKDNGIKAYFICWNSPDGFLFQNKKFDDQVEIIAWKRIEHFEVEE